MKTLFPRPNTLPEEFAYVSTLTAVHTSASARTFQVPEHVSAKNRYADILPNEDTRVRLGLATGRSSDYINANFIFLDSVTCICTQSPLTTTIADFWTMIYEQRSPVICALNDITPNHDDVYWPIDATQPLRLGDIELILLASYRLDQIGIVLRYFCLRFDAISLLTESSRADEAERLVVQVHYHDWPDKSVPGSTEGVRAAVLLVQYYQEQGRLSGSNGPAVVHCSAGVGRSGVFLAVASIVRSSAFLQVARDPVFRAEVSPEMDGFSIPGYVIQPPAPPGGWESFLQRFGVLEVVITLRKQRNSCMVQTESQYIFIYEVLRDFILNFEKPSPILEAVARFHIAFAHHASSTALAIPSFDVSINPSNAMSAPSTPQRSISQSTEADNGQQRNLTSFIIRNRSISSLYFDSLPGITRVGALQHDSFDKEYKVVARDCVDEMEIDTMELSRPLSAREQPVAVSRVLAGQVVLSDAVPRRSGTIRKMAKLRQHGYRSSAPLPRSRLDNE